MAYNETLLYGLDIIYYFQQFRSPLLDSFLAAITLLGQEEFYLLALPLVLWTVDFKAGIRLSLIVMISHYLNLYIKDLVAEPRPFLLRPEVQLSSADGYSFPSNHAQTGLVFWTYLAWLFKSRLLWIAGVIIVGLIGVSRVYLGVHFPTDVLAGWYLGAALFFCFSKAEQSLFSWGQGLRLWQQACLVLILPGLLFALQPGKESASIMAAVSGAGLGLLLSQHFFYVINAVPVSEGSKLAGRLGLGLLGLFIIWGGLKTVFPQDSAEFGLIFRYLRYLLAGLWFTLGAPLIFGVINLSPGKNTLDRTKWFN